MAAPHDWTDADLLLAMHLRETGMSCTAIAEAFGKGFTKNAIIGATGRVRVADNAAHAGDADPDRHDAAAGPDWLTDGLIAAGEHAPVVWRGFGCVGERAVGA